MDYQLIWWVFVLPLFGFLWQSLAGKIVIDNLGVKIGRPLMGACAVLPIAAGFAIAAQLTQKLASEPETARSHILTLFDWIHVNGLQIPFEFRVDTLSMTMVLIITGIGSLIHLYATGYMSEEKDYPRFFTYLNLFIAAMLMLVLGNNLVLLFIGWEGVGVCSYLLIGFWYKDVNNSKAANKAFIVNRIGDYGLTLGMFLIVYMLVSFSDAAHDPGGPRLLSYDVIFAHAQEVFAAYPAMTTAVALLLFVGAMGKSAQFPLYIWLPDAMAGPTPVSALIHAATMVTSGVFLLNRMSPIFGMSEMAMGIVALVGAVTSLQVPSLLSGRPTSRRSLPFPRCLNWATCSSLAAPVRTGRACST
ncbi:MAG: proton-conducting transporter membrane subunit [Armatimonadota bacterium]